MMPAPLTPLNFSKWLKSLFIAIFRGHCLPSENQGRLISRGDLASVGVKGWVARSPITTICDCGPLFSTVRRPKIHSPKTESRDVLAIFQMTAIPLSSARG